MTTEPSLGTCVRCSGEVYADNRARQAMGKLYHNSCFTCSICSQHLQEQPFYTVSARLFCEDHFMFSETQHSTEICDSCGFPVQDMVLQALGNCYHPACFCCIICHQSLEGAQFCLDSANRVYCFKDYHSYVAPTCVTCGLPILPIMGSLVTERIVSMDRDYHVECFH